MADKKWKGIQMNFSLYQGEIPEDPVSNSGYVFMTLRTKVVQKDANGQFVELDQDIPLIVEPGGPVNVATNHIKAGRKLAAWCHYKTWNAQGALQHAFVVNKFDLGDKPFEQQTGGGNAPPIPG